MVDASVLATALADDGPAGRAYRHRLEGEELCAPEIVDLEVTSVLRRAEPGGGSPTRGSVRRSTTWRP